MEKKGRLVVFCFFMILILSLSIISAGWVGKLFGKEPGSNPVYFSPGEGLMRGDVDDNGVVDDLDYEFLIDYLYKGGDAPYPLEIADVNNDGAVNNLDITYLINYLHKGGPQPVPFGIVSNLTISLKRGDVNKDGFVGDLDSGFLQAYLYKGGPAPEPSALGDVNADGTINLLDITYLINYLHKGGPAPLAYEEEVVDECTEAGYKCTSPIRGCGHYQEYDLSCGDVGDIVICCEEIPYCGDGVCFTHDIPGYGETTENCPEDCECITSTFAVAEGETITASFNGKSYDVLINYIDASGVKFIVNGENVPTSGKLSEGSSYKLKDGTLIKVNNIMFSNSALGSVKFSLSRGCVEKTCTDSDNGKNYYVVGSCSVSFTQGGTGTADICFASTTPGGETGVGECYCDKNNEIATEDYVCPDGCSEGVCVSDVCQELINKIAKPESFTYNGVEYSLSYSMFYRQNFLINGEEQKAMEYYASWYAYSGGQNHNFDYSVFIFDDKNFNPESWIKRELDYMVCRAISLWDINGEKNKVYVCNWDPLKEMQSSDSYQYTSREIFWVNDNILVKVYSHIGKYLSDEELLLLSQKRLNDFLNDLKDNQGEYIGWSELGLDYPFLGLIGKDLADCGSDISEDVCSSCWTCNIEPAVCPPHGYQTKTCTDFCCDNTIEQRRECTPGICSGCLVPKWFGRKWSNNKCIPYGFRFEQETGDFIDQIIEVKDSDRLEEFNDEGEISLVIESATKAILTIYDSEAVPHEYILTPGAEIELDLPDDFGQYIEFILIVDKIHYDPDGGSYIDITIKYTYMGQVYEKMNAYCDIDGRVKRQKTIDASGNWANCQNNYECESNVCSSGECIEVTKMLQEASVFKKMAVKFFCRVFNPFSDTEYNNCMTGFLGNPPSSGGSGGGSLANNS